MADKLIETFTTLDGEYKNGRMTFVSGTFMVVAGTKAAINPDGIVQIKDKLYIVDCDSQKFVIRENDELANIPAGGKLNQ